MEILSGLFFIGVGITVLFCIPCTFIYFACEYFDWLRMGDFFETLIIKIFLPILFATSAIGILMLWSEVACALVNTAKEMI